MDNELKTNKTLVELARRLWMARLGLTARRERLKQFTYGDQWVDPVVDRSGRLVSEREMLKNDGLTPLTNNLIRRLVRTIVGRYRDSLGDSRRTDQRDEIDSRLLEEFLISGQAVQRVADDNPLHGYLPMVENVCPDAFFVNDYRDPRGLDVEVVGMLHDMSPGEMMMRFGGETSRRREIIGNMIATSANQESDGLMASVFSRAPLGRVRVIEIWTREYILDSPADERRVMLDKEIVRLGRDEENRRPNGRIVWRCRWLTPDGFELDDYLSPWRHGHHPFVFKAYPLIDGEIHPFVEDLIGQQQHINRLIVLIDKVMATSAKGVLLYPVNQLPNGLTLDDVADQWSSPSGVLPITGAPGPMPHQVSTSGSDNQAHRLLEIELKLFSETSGVSDALSGTSGTLNPRTGADLYRQQVANATIAMADILKTFNSAIDLRDSRLENL